MTEEAITGLAACNGAQLYFEKRGSGPGMLLIAGSTGDAGNFSRAAERLSDAYTVVVYDRRGNSRSPRPAGWAATSVAEQADDAAALIESLDLAPTVVFGASAGGPIALDLMSRHPRLVRAGIVQEPSIFSVLPDPQSALAPRRALLEEGLRHGGPREAIKALMRYLNDDAVFTAIPPEALERMLGNADTILSIEAPGFAGWMPSIETLRASRIPLTLVVASETLPAYKEVTRWLADRLHLRVMTVPGYHGFYYYRPQDLDGVIRGALLRRKQRGS